LLVGDIDRGGIFAQLLGTLSLLPPEEQVLVRGLVVNKFRGDANLFADGIHILEDRGGVRVLGVIPYLPGLAIPEEDSVALDSSTSATVDIAVVRLPHIANYDDFDSLRSEAGVELRYVQSPAALGTPHAIILPGTKSTIADLQWLRAQGFAEAIQNLAARETAVVGICGGYQMLGRVICDPNRIESSIAEIQGLGLLPMATMFEAIKATFQARAIVRGREGWLAELSDQELEGYEIHMGRTEGQRPWLQIVRRNGLNCDVADGAISDDGRVWGCYLHGIFGNDGFRQAWMDSLRRQAPNSALKQTPRCVSRTRGRVEDSLERLADAVESALDMNRLDAIIEGSD
jgi:adenosylcobyric acid synthase